MERVTNDPDADLVNGCRTGRPEAWTELCARYAGGLYRLVLSITGDSSGSEDVVQETLLEVLKKLPQFHGTGLFQGWLFKIARNKALEHGRKRRPKPCDRLPELCPKGNGADNPVQILSDRELRNQTDTAIRQLPEKRRTAWLLREVEDLSFREIAEVLKVSEPRARGLHLEARRQLAASLKENGWGPN